MAGQGQHAPARRCAELPDGSWLAHVNDPARGAGPAAAATAMRRRRGSTLAPATGPLPGITVRVIEFAPDRHRRRTARTRTERYRLLTTLADWRAVPGRGRWPPGTPGGGPSRPGTRNSRPTCADPAGGCAAGPPNWPARNYGPSWPSTRPSAPSSPAPPPAPASTPPDLLHRDPAHRPPHPDRRPPRHGRRPGRRPKPRSSPAWFPAATAASAPAPSRPSRSNDMNAALMLLVRHERGIHALSGWGR